MARVKVLNVQEIDRLLAHERPTQTPAQLQTAMEQLSAQFGIPLRRIPWKRQVAT